MTLRSKICKIFDNGEKGKVKISDFLVIFPIIALLLMLAVVLNIIITIGLAVPMIVYEYEPLIIYGTIDTFPFFVYSLTNMIYGLISFVFIIIPLFVIVYLIFSIVMLPILSKIGNITILKCDLKEQK